MIVKTIKFNDGVIKMVNQKELDRIIESKIPYKVIDRKEI